MTIRAGVLAMALGVPMHLAAQVQKDSVAAPRATADSGTPPWQYGAYAAIPYLGAPNEPDNHVWRSRGTTFVLNGLQLDMANAYVRRAAAANSRLGMEFTLQAGIDTRVFGFSATAPNIHGWRTLRQFGPTNVSYLAPVGNGLTLQGGIFGSYIGYDALYAKDNLNYTRPWGADYTPYFMLGANAQYPFGSKVTGTLLLVNGYWHLARANNVPSTGGQIAYKPMDHLTIKHTVLYGPHQSSTALEFWRVLFDNIAEWRTDRVVVALEYFVGAEKVDSTGTPGTVWMSAQLPMRYTFNPHVTLAFRPELYWDPDGRTTLARQSVKATTATLELRQPSGASNVILRLEHRLDGSRGPDGGFFRDGAGQLVPTQNLFIAALLLNYDGKSHD
ncbi:MAG TPA: outer membrane beta-barrel protein [Gemmatimonadaceae bacterium]|nr:outer membrane beta-barrel protein [Gemmatimonadaceae bacterium]